MIVLVARYVCKPGLGDAVEEALRRMAALVRRHEPGCVLYQCCRSQSNPDVFLLYEQYETYYSVKHESLDTNVSVSCGHWRW